MQASSSEASYVEIRGVCPQAVAAPEQDVMYFVHAGLLELKNHLSSLKDEVELFKSQITASSSPVASSTVTTSAVESPPAAEPEEFSSQAMIQAEFTSSEVVWKKNELAPYPVDAVEELSSEDTTVFEARVRQRRAAKRAPPSSRRCSDRQRRPAYRCSKFKYSSVRAEF